MISARLRGPSDLLVLGVVRGLASEVPPMLASVTAFAPAVVGLAMAPEELRGLTEHFVGPAAEPLVPLTPTELSEAHGLSRFGEVRVPSPSTLQLLEWARSGGVPVEALDPSDEEYADLFTDHISYVELVRRTVRERRVTKSAPTAQTAEEFSDRWHRTVAGGRGSRSFEAARGAAVARVALGLSGRYLRIAVLVDRERFEVLGEQLRAVGFAPTSTAA